MIRLKQSLGAWGTDAFKEHFKAEVEALDAADLPLQQGLSLSSCVSDEPFRIMVIDAMEEPERIRVKAGVFYSGIIAGCSCADDPGPMEVQNEYCTLAFTIDRESAAAAIEVLLS